MEWFMTAMCSTRYPKKKTRHNAQTLPQPCFRGMIRPMELKYLKSIVAVADEGSITSAARRLRIGQPALTRQLQALESEIGSSLLERNSRGILLTEAGTAFAKDARAILEATDAAVGAAQARARGAKGELNVDYAPSPTAKLLPPALLTLEKSVPEVTVTLHDLAGDELLAGLVLE